MRVAAREAMCHTDQLINEAMGEVLAVRLRARASLGRPIEGHEAKALENALSAMEHEVRRLKEVADKAIRQAAAAMAEPCKEKSEC
jgi:hypothetical protein